jgi:hypothetical protein
MERELNGSGLSQLEPSPTIGAFIEAIYNRQQLHSALDYLSPDKYEARLGRFSGGDVTAGVLEHRDLLLISCLTSAAAQAAAEENRPMIG